MSKLIQVAKLIESKIKELDSLCLEIDKKASNKAEFSAIYDKRIAIKIIKLKNGEEFNFEGDTIKDPSVSSTDKIAKGLCWADKLNAEQSDAEYKALITKIESVKAQLNGYQSINRYLSETEGE